MPIGSELLVSRAQPQSFADQLIAPPRGSKYRELYVQDLVPNFNALADEGAYFVATNPTLGTGVAGPSATAFSATSALLTLRNKDGAGGKRVYLDYMRFICTATPTSATSLNLAVVIDNSGRDSAGTPLTPQNPNMDSTTGSIAVPNYTPTVAAATSSARTLARVTPKTAAAPCLAVGDQFVFVFGQVEKVPGILQGTTTPATYVSSLPPVVLGPGANELVLMHLWLPAATTAPSFEFDMGWYER